MGSNREPHTESLSREVSCTWNKMHYPHRKPVCSRDSRTPRPLLPCPCLERPPASSQSPLLVQTRIPIPPSFRGILTQDQELGQGIPPAPQGSRQHPYCNSQLLLPLGDRRLHHLTGCEWHSGRSTHGQDLGALPYQKPILLKH